MSESSASSPSVRAFHLPTLIAIAIVAFALANVAHEGLGHGGMCVAVGGKPLILNAIYFDCDRDALQSTASRWISAAGTLVNLALALLTTFVIRMRFVRAPSGRYFLWLFLVLNLFQATGYWMFSGLGGIGDWNAVVRGTPFYLAARVVLAIVGAGAYFFFVIPLALRGLAPFLGAADPERIERGRRLCVPAYLAGGMLYVTAGLLNPEGLKLVLISAVAASFGGASGLFWMWNLLRNRGRFPPVSEPADAAGAALGIERSWPWIGAGAAIALAFVLILGPGIHFG
ncbi:MAG: hypothetical protein ABI639_09575 [Thermoanaerobaculia bacterium]